MVALTSSFSVNPIWQPFRATFLWVFHIWNYKIFRGILHYPLTWNTTEQMFNASNWIGPVDKHGKDYQSVNIYITLPTSVIHLLLSVFLCKNCKCKTKWIFTRLAHRSNTDFKQCSLLVADTFSLLELFEVLEECVVCSESLLTCKIVCSAFTAFPLGHNTWKKRKSQGAYVRL